MKCFARFGLPVVATFLLQYALAQARPTPSTPTTKLSLGEVHFPISCKRQVQPRFDEGVALLQSFEFTEAEQAFGQVETVDPQCVIAAWGMALSKTERNGANAPSKVLAAGWQQLQPWLAVKAGTEREQMYISAVRAMYEDYDKRSSAERGQLYLTRMQEIRRKYPQDINASLFYALSDAFSAGPGPVGLAQRRKALAILLPIFHKYPNNPGAAHYIIHAADTAELAPKALEAAREYAAIAPDSPHALHMPSHIFNRLGYWNDSIQTNEASARAAAEWIGTGRDGQFDELHALNNIEYAYLQLGKQEQARAVIERIKALSAKPGGDPWTVLEAEIYFYVETQDWNEALKLQSPPQSKFADNFEIYWLHTIASARLGNASEAEASLEAFRRSLSEWEKIQGSTWENIWGPIFNIALSEAEAWTMFSQGEHNSALAHLVEAEKYEHDHPMYYADVLPRPTAEMAGDMLLEMQRPTEALEAYMTALQFAPRRFDSLHGAEIAAERAGKRRIAAGYIEQIRAEGGALTTEPQ